MTRWTDLATWRGPTQNRTEGGQRRIDGLVVHIAEGYYEGTIAWCKNPDANVSSNWVGGREHGERAQLVDLDDAAWTQRDGNGEWVSIEMAGFTLGHDLHKPGWERLTGAQIEFAAQLYARLHREYGVPLRLAKSPAEQGLGYHSMGAEHGYNWGHDDCPGEPIKAQLPLILARAIDIVNGVNDVQLSDLLSDKKTTVNNALMTLLARTDYLTNRLGLEAKLGEILKAAVDDGGTTVTMTEEDRAALAVQLAEAIHVPTVDDFADAVGDRQAAADRAAADVLDGEAAPA